MLTGRFHHWDLQQSCLCDIASLWMINFLFITKGCKAGQLCQVPEAMWWPVCGVQHKLFHQPAHHLPFLVRNIRTDKFCPLQTHVCSSIFILQFLNFTLTKGRLTVVLCNVCLSQRIVQSVLFESWEIIGPYRAWWLLNGLLLVLQVLHIIWFYLVARIAIKAIFKGKVGINLLVCLCYCCNTNNRVETGECRSLSLWLWSRLKYLKYKSMGSRLLDRNPDLTSVFFNTFSSFSKIEISTLMLSQSQKYIMIP